MKPEYSMDNVFYYKLKNGEEILSIQEDTGSYIKGIMNQVTLKLSDNKNSENELIDSRKLIAELKKELRSEKKKYSKHIEMHYPMRVVTMPIGNSQGALHLSFWVSPSIFSRQVVHIPESEILLKTPVDLNIKNYYFSTIRKYLVLYASKLLGLSGTDNNNSINSEDDFFFEEDENKIGNVAEESDSTSEEKTSIRPKETKDRTYITLGNGLKKTVH
jgi:hypothetical protein